MARSSFYSFKEAKAAAKARYPDAKFTRIAPGGWLGNGMGNSPATYAMVLFSGRRVCLIWSSRLGDDWQIADQE